MAGDVAFLVPVKVAASQVPHPSAVFLRRGNSPALEEFSLDLTADSSLIGVAAFTLADRTGDRRADLTYIENRCGASGCRTAAKIQTWDGSAWRDVGPADTGISNVDSAGWEGSGATSTLRVHGAKLPATAPIEAGPSRASTTTYGLVGARYAVTEIEHDPPEYLYHAFLDAEEVFQSDREAAISVFERLLVAEDLKDWKVRPGQPDRRPSLQGFALFRIALATAVLQKDAATVSAALDRLVLESRKPGYEPLFVNVAMEFRRGFNEGGGLIGGCAAVNLYLSRPGEGTNTPAYVEQLFNYGYANPPGSRWLSEICPF